MADSSPPHVHLKKFSGLLNENWPEFERLLRASLAVSRIPEANHQRERYLHLHLAGNALNYYLQLAENTRNDLVDSLANLAIVDDPAAHIDRTDERTRRLKEQFFQDMPFKYKKVLLKENDNITVNELCAIIK